jgi:hypothetical protein
MPMPIFLSTFFHGTTHLVFLMFFGSINARESDVKWPLLLQAWKAHPTADIRELIQRALAT